MDGFWELVKENRNTPSPFCAWDLLDTFDKLGEDFWIFHCQLGEDFSIESDIFLLESRDEGPIGGSVLPESIIETDNPERAEGALLGSAVAAGILAGFDDGLFGLGKEFLAAPAIPFGFLEDIFVAFLGHHTTLDSGHRQKIKM